MIYFTRSIKLLMVVFCLFTSGLILGNSDTETAVKVVEQFQAELLATMKNAGVLGYEGRYDKLKPAVSDSHDLEGIARISVGRFWREFSDEQKQTMVDTFSKLSIATYASRFDGYSGESFTTASSEEMPRGDQIIRTILTKADGEEIRLDYVLHNKDGKWLIINIIAQGVSDLGIKRAEYSRILVTEDFDTLITKLEEKIERNSQKDA